MNRTTALYLTAETGPVIAFFIAGRLTDFYGAATVLIVATFFACLLSWVAERRVPAIPVISALFVIASAILTIRFQDPDILIFADTVFYATFAITLTWSLWRGSLILKKLFDGVFAITDDGWRALMRNWLIFMIVAGCANEFVRQTATPDFWIDYRFYKTILMLIFASTQFYVTAHYRIPQEATSLGIRIIPPVKNTR